jgi:hypothetical protein
MLKTKMVIQLVSPFPDVTVLKLYFRRQ